MERVTYQRVTAHNVLTTLRCEGWSLTGAPNFSSRSQNGEKTIFLHSVLVCCIFRPCANGILWICMHFYIHILCICNICTMVSYGFVCIFRIVSYGFVNLYNRILWICMHVYIRILYICMHFCSPIPWIRVHF
jgi:hypothetical protein